MCTLPVVEAIDPNQKLGEKLGTKAQDPNATPKQVAQILRDQMVEQVKKIVRAPLLRKNKEVAIATASVVAVAIIVIMGVSVQDDMARIQLDLQSVL